MSVCRIEKKKDYTVIANHHLKNVELSLKAKGLLTLMLSLPPKWDYTIKGLSSICKDGQDSINSAVKELENAGYVTRQRIRNAKGHLTTVEYIIREEPVDVTEEKENKPKREKPKQENPEQVKPEQVKPKQEEPKQENPYQLSTNQSSTYKSSIYESNPNQSNQKKKMDAIRSDEYKQIQEMIYDNLEYNTLEEMEFLRHGETRKCYDMEQIDEIVAIMVETLASTKETINISGQDYDADFVKERLLKIDLSHIDYVIDCLKTNTTRVKNMRKYLLASLFNAPSTINNYYSSMVQHDMANPKNERN